MLVNLLVMNYRPLFNGDAGLAIVPAPLQSGVMTTTSTAYQWGFAAGAVVLAGGVYWFVRHITESPYGRTLRAMRDNDKVADSLGKNLRSLRTGMLLLGGAIAGLSGGVLVSFISVWSPAAWTYAETIVLFAAVIIGGRGNHLGAVLGAVIVPVGFEESTRLISQREPEPAAQPAPLAPVGGDRAAHRLLPVVPPAGRPARAQTGDRLAPVPAPAQADPLVTAHSAWAATAAAGPARAAAGPAAGLATAERAAAAAPHAASSRDRTSCCRRSMSAGTSAACTRSPASRWRCGAAA